MLARTARTDIDTRTPVHMKPHLCQCGCGQPTGVARQSRRGYKKGEPLRYAPRHRAPSATTNVRRAPRTCVCGRTFAPSERYQEYCSRDCSGLAHRQPLIERFWSKVNKYGPSDCWLWTSTTVGRGHGTFFVKSYSRPVLAHRFSWELVHGPIGNDLEVCHRCDVPGCVNPSHLFLGTRAHNMSDAAHKGLMVSAPKITLAEVLAIEQSDERAVVLAERYGLHTTSVYRIRRQRHRRGQSQWKTKATIPIERIEELSASCTR